MSGHSTPPHSWGGGRGAAGGAGLRRASTSFLDVLARGAEQRALEVVTDQRPARFEQVVEGLQQLALGRLGLAVLGLDPLAHVSVEKVYRLPRRPLDRSGGVLAELHQRGQR